MNLFSKIEWLSDDVLGLMSDGLIECLNVFVPPWKESVEKWCYVVDSTTFSGRNSSPFFPLLTFAMRGKQQQALGRIRRIAGIQ